MSFLTKLKEKFTIKQPSLKIIEGGLGYYDEKQLDLILSEIPLETTAVFIDIQDTFKSVQILMYINGPVYPVINGEVEKVPTDSFEELHFLYKELNLYYNLGIKEFLQSCNLYAINEETVKKLKDCPGILQEFFPPGTTLADIPLADFSEELFINSQKIEHSQSKYTPKAYYLGVDYYHFTN